VPYTRLVVGIVTILFAQWRATGWVRAQAGSEAAEVEILDNSFLIEEAFNQEQGIVQHIFNWIPSWHFNQRDERTFDFSFTQEWPVGSQLHQFSYTIPFSNIIQHEDGRLISKVEGIGDILLNYRLQVLDGEGGTVAFSPRFSVILPTGDEEKGLGNGVVGYQVNLPFSRQLEDRAYHFNAGFTITPDVVAGVDPALGFTGGTLHGYNLGGSAIKFVRPDFHLMLELLALWDESLLEDQTTDGSVEVFVSPGFRWAAYTEGETQLVLGTAVPIGLTRDTPDVSVFLYLSFEHRFRPED
jgi:hypothetical protein